MRPKTKDDAQRVSLTLSGPKRKILMDLAMARGVSRTQIIEDLLEAKDHANNMLIEGKANARPGGDVGNIHNPSGGGSEPLIQYLPTSKTNLEAK